jgi:hypothetical protein
MEITKYELKKLVAEAYDEGFGDCQDELDRMTIRQNRFVRNSTIKRIMFMENE